MVIEGFQKTQIFRNGRRKKRIKTISEVALKRPPPSKTSCARENHSNLEWVELLQVDLLFIQDYISKSNHEQHEWRLKHHTVKCKCKHGTSTKNFSTLFFITTIKDATQHLLFLSNFKVIMSHNGTQNISTHLDFLNLYSYCVKN